MEDSYDEVDIDMSNTEAPEYRWWCQNCVLVVAGIDGIYPLSITTK